MWSSFGVTSWMPVLLLSYFQRFWYTPVVQCRPFQALVKRSHKSVALEDSQSKRWFFWRGLLARSNTLLREMKVAWSGSSCCFFFSLRRLKTECFLCGFLSLNSHCYSGELSACFGRKTQGETICPCRWGHRFYRNCSHFVSVEENKRRNNRILRAQWGTFCTASHLTIVLQSCVPLGSTFIVLDVTILNVSGLKNGEWETLTLNYFLFLSLTHILGDL